jgi:hypothetical protein
VEEYAVAGVETYILIDTIQPRGQATLQLIGYTLAPDGYQLLAPDERGRLWLEVPRIWLGIEGLLRRSWAAARRLHCPR